MFDISFIHMQGLKDMIQKRGGIGSIKGIHRGVVQWSVHLAIYLHKYRWYRHMRATSADSIPQGRFLQFDSLQLHTTIFHRFLPQGRRNTLHARLGPCELASANHSQRRTPGSLGRPVTPRRVSRKGQLPLNHPKQQGNKQQNL